MIRPQLVELERVPGTSIWWPPGRGPKGERIEGVLVIAFQAPLSFLNAYSFQDGMRRALRQRRAAPDLVVLEASNVIEVDFTAAQILCAIINDCKGLKIAVAVARLESLRAQEAFERLGVIDALERTHLFHSVDEAIKAFAKKVE